MLTVLAMLKLAAIDKADRSLPFARYLQSDKEDESCGIVDKGISRHTTKVRHFSCVDIETRKWQRGGLSIGDVTVHRKLESF